MAVSSAKVPRGEPHPLIGMTFLSCTRQENGKEEVDRQGEIRAIVTTATEVGNCALVDYFSWTDGSHSYSQLIPLIAFAKAPDSESFYKLFPSQKARDDYYSRIHSLRSVA